MRALWQRIRGAFIRRYRLLWIEDGGASRRELRLPGWGWFITLVGIGGVIWLIFAFTPLRYTMPGYPTSQFRKLYGMLLDRVQQLEQKVAQHLLLVEELRKMQGVIRSEPTAAGLPLLPTLQSGQYILPIEGRVSRRLQAAQEHWGVDITCGAGEPVLAMAEGTVVLAEYSYHSGYIIAIQHPNGLVSLYKHNSRLLRRVGERIQVGDVIALSGGLGTYSSGPHLHIETWLGGRPLDPLKLLAYEE
ncbi:MAG: M23 family metallopeptidase [Bacteroidia bacterium]|nr:M23 family metallopeptidase [Bacteroidia bacterium]